MVCPINCTLLTLNFCLCSSHLQVTNPTLKLNYSKVRLCPSNSFSYSYSFEIIFTHNFNHLYYFCSVFVMCSHFVIVTMAELLVP